MSFEDSLREGLLGESAITKWLNARGCSVLPAYEIEQSHGKGPRLFTPGKQLVSPDLLCINKDKTICWIEAKIKTAFTWHRKSKTWQTGIDRRHWQDYQQVAVITCIPVWLLFLHRPGNNAKDTPDGMESPHGLFGNDITVLAKSVDHEHDNYGPSGMVYWSDKAFRRLDDAMPVGGKDQTQVTLFSDIE